MAADCLYERRNVSSPFVRRAFADSEYAGEKLVKGTVDSARAFFCAASVHAPPASDRPCFMTFEADSYPTASCYEKQR